MENGGFHGFQGVADKDPYKEPRHRYFADFWFTVLKLVVSNLTPEKHHL